MTRNDVPVDGLPVHRATPAQEMLAFDRLGPRARSALNDLPVKISAHGILSSLSTPAFAAHPAFDAMIADTIRKRVQIHGSK